MPPRHTLANGESGSGVGTLTPAVGHTKRSEDLEKTRLTLGFIPLIDCAPLVLGAEKGFFANEGLDVAISREASWSNIRDKVALGALDGAQMLAPMPLAASLGLGGVPRPVVTAFGMGLNGNAITVSRALFEHMAEVDPLAMAQRPVSARVLKNVIEIRRKRGEERLTFASVFPYSNHNYLLRYWMAAAGIDPDADVRLIVVPPPDMVRNLDAGTIDGYCVGEPWNTVAEHLGAGHTIITTYEIWNNHPEKVFGVGREWAEQHPNTHLALLRALIRTAQWLDQEPNREVAAAILARPHYLNLPVNVVRESLGCMGGGAPGVRKVFHRYAANYPWRSHARWVLEQMRRWGQIDATADIDSVAEAAYQPEIYRRAAAQLGLATPSADGKTEGEHAEPWTGEGGILMGEDRFIDGAVYPA
ncbi:MAG: ABC transporter substrate-binding protein [Chromatiales bacterium]|nr:ABC transporter substrate-binding protein [Chromatiales bacterium]